MSVSDPDLFTFPSQRLTLSAAAWGDAANPLVILVHGGLDQKRSWDWTARALADRYYVVAPDLRGHGTSEWVNDGDYLVMDHVYDLASLADHLGSNRFKLVGHSLGGNISLRYAGLFPERVEKLVAIEGLGPSPKLIADRAAEPVHERFHKWIERRRGYSERTPRVMKDFEEALTRMSKAHPWLRVDQLEHLTRTGLKENEAGGVSWAYDPAAIAPSPADIRRADFITLLRRITCPVWLAYGEKSWASNPEKDGRIKDLSTAQLKEYPGAGHWLHHDSFNDFIRDLSGFLDG